MSHVIKAAASILQMSADELEQSLERARVVGALDEFSVNAKCVAPTTNIGPDGKWGTYVVGHRLPHGSKTGKWIDAKWFKAETPDAARAAAVLAIENGEV